MATMTGLCAQAVGQAALQLLVTRRAVSLSDSSEVEASREGSVN